MTAACETLELAKSQLYVAGQTVSGTPGSGYGNNAVVSASKDLLQAVLRVRVIAIHIESSNKGFGLFGFCFGGGCFFQT